MAEHKTGAHPESIRLENVSRVYNTDGTTLAALKDITLSIKKGDKVAIMGRSGSGKSTLLHLLGCLDRPTHGELWIDGVKASRMSIEALAKLRREKIGFVFQSFHLISTLDALHNVAMPMMLDGMPKEKRLRRAEELLRSLGLGERLDHYPNQLSGGEKQRVAIARALANEPSIILADEPTGNLDSKAGEEVLDLFENLHDKGGKTVIIVTHERYVAETCHRTIHLKDGMLDDKEKIRGRG